MAAFLHLQFTSDSSFVFMNKENLDLLLCFFFLFQICLKQMLESFRMRLSEFKGINLVEGFLMQSLEQILL